MPASIHFVRRLTGLLILSLSTGVFLWGIWPLPDASESVLLPPGLRLALDWPITARIGDARSVRMQIEPDPSAEPVTASAAPLAGDQDSNVMAAARLEFAGLLFYPGDMVSQPLRQGKPLAFRWEFRPEDSGDYPGVAWLYFLGVPLDGGPETVTPVSAREIRIRTVDLYGLSGPDARFLGGLGFLVGGLLGLDGALAWLQKRLRRQAGVHPAPGFLEQ